MDDRLVDAPGDAGGRRPARTGGRGFPDVAARATAVWLGVAATVLAGLAAAAFVENRPTLGFVIAFCALLTAIFFWGAVSSRNRWHAHEAGRAALQRLTTVGPRAPRAPKASRRRSR